ncbi:MAG TPA: ABC transporter substrate-binding protein, partial [Dehalococcoidia bacterium]|nr:ABC transporter substrate-binding protein [Dehalococcoidia bacterium]
MTEGSSNYWARFMQRRHNRRALVRGAVLAGAGLSAVGLACKASPGANGGASTSTSGGAGQAQPKSAVSGLIGRTQAEPKGDTPVTGGTLNWYIGANPPTMDPHQNVSVNTLYMASGALSRIYRFKTGWDVAVGNNLDVEPDLGASAESPDGVTWTVKLRPNLKMQNVAPLNGRAVDPEDIKATFAKATLPASVNAGNLGMIDPAQIETPDKQTVVFKLKYPYAPFPKLLASGAYSWIMPKEAAAGAYDTAKKIVGSGPFILDTYTPDVAVTFKKNPDYYEQGRPYVDGVRVAIIVDPNARIAQFTGGNLDYLGMPLLENVPTIKQQNPKADAIRNVSSGNGVMYYNLRDASSPFQDIRVRQALNLAMDRDAYASGSGYAPGEYVQTFTVPPNVGKWAAMVEDYPADTLQSYKFDLVKAKQLMEAAGVKSIKMVYPAGNPADPQLGRQADIARNMLSQLPWNLSYANVDYNKDWINGGKGIGYPGGGVPADSMAWWGWSSRTEVDEYLFSFWHSKGAGNFMHVTDPQIDAGIDKARTVLNEDDRIKAYKDVQRYIAA